MPEFILLGTEHCHLCEEAESILHSAGLVFKTIDIVDDEALMAAYGLRIPVLREMDTGNELNWPFNLPELLAFVPRPSKQID
jgi:hypothetical protein